MTAHDILEQVSLKYQLIICNEHHVQIKLANGRKHNLWPMRTGGVKLQLAGKRETNVFYDANKLIKTLSVYDYQKHSDHSRLIELERLITKVTEGDAIYCDAGFKDGRSKIAVIRVFGPEIDVHVRLSCDHPDSVSAEIAAIKFAKRRFTCGSMIYSDCQEAVRIAQEVFPEIKNRVKWVCRSNNEAADKCSNLRGG